jgi:GNAT superfamily N-acetyltransferase
VIRPLQHSEIPLLADFPPKEWKLDLPQLMSMHFHYPYFYPIVAEENGTLAGCGIAMIHGTVSWLGTIIVLPEFRNRGIGRSITEHLIATCAGRGCATQILTASALGEPIYRKLGFIITGQYDIYRKEAESSYIIESNCRIATEDDYDKIRKMDHEITGEDRFALIKRYLTDAWVYDDTLSHCIRGVFFPAFGQGLILAYDEEVGIALMKFRLNQKRSSVVIPSTNRTAKPWLEAEGFQLTQTLPRMVLGEDVAWKPHCIYNRATGYCG